MTSRMFRTITVRLPDLALYRFREEEQMGTKPKLWLGHMRTGQRIMLKFARENTGEDWSEKVASHIASHLGVPCPRVELAIVEGSTQGQFRHAVLCWSFLRRRPRESLIHGNELLLRADPDYPTENAYQASEHTLVAVHDVLRHHAPPVSLAQWTIMETAFDAFVGYLMLDALIGNTDRHHENWGVTSARSHTGQEHRLAPSYDHASSLGRELTDRKREGRLGTSGRGTVAEYAERATSGFWDEHGMGKLSTFGALLRAARIRPRAFLGWQSRLQAVQLGDLQECVEQVPSGHLGPVGKEFAGTLLAHNYTRLVNLEPST